MSTVLGITGGIATGKSTAVNYLRKLGFPIVDADKIARKVVKPGTEGLKAIVQAFGSTILTDSGELNRQKLGTLIFTNEQQRKRLNHLLAPLIRQEMNAQIKENKKHHPLVIVDIPLLFEENYEQSMDIIAVVYLPEKMQIQRLMARDQLSKEAAQQRISSQWPIEEKKKRAQIIFNNEGTVLNLNMQIINWLKKQHYLNLKYNENLHD